MPVNLINLYSTRNLGDAAILSGFVKLSPDGQAMASIPDKSPIPIKGLIHATRLDPAFPFVSVGGDIFNNARPTLVTRRFLENLRALMACRQRTAVFGQSIPKSCRGLAFQALAMCMRGVGNVVVRDEESWRRLTDAGVSASLSFDTAFALEPAADLIERGSAILAANRLVAANAALFSLRGFDDLYPHDEATFLLKVGSLIRIMSARGHQCGLIIQADAEGSDSDIGLAKRMRAEGLPIEIVDLVGTASNDPVGDMMAVLGAANIVLAVRYHSAVLRLLTGRLPVVLSYSNKTRDLIDRLGLPGVDVVDMDPASVLQLAEASASGSFDPSGARKSVRDHFAASIEAVGGWRN